MSLPLTGPVADLSKAGYQGYQLWASQLNAAGGLLGRQVNLKVLDDGFDPNQTATDYTRLISQNHVDLLLGTFSSLLNAPASAIAARQRMLYVEPSGGTASLFSRGFTNLFFAQPGTTTSLPDRFVEWIASLPASQRPADRRLHHPGRPERQPGHHGVQVQAPGPRGQDRLQPDLRSEHEQLRHDRLGRRARSAATGHPGRGRRRRRAVRPVAGESQVQPEDAVPDERPVRTGLPERGRPAERPGRVHRRWPGARRRSTRATPPSSPPTPRSSGPPPPRTRRTPTPPARS